jgi:glucose/arabinose dehydrogenase
MRRSLFLLIPFTLLACSLLQPTGQTPLPHAGATIALPPANPTGAIPTATQPTSLPEATTTPPSSNQPVQDFPDISRWTWIQVASGLTRPLDIKQAGDSRLFIVEKKGRILILENDGLLPDPFLDIRDRVGSSGNEQGLLGLAFHPDYVNNGYFYLDYTDLHGNTVVSRFRTTSQRDKADPASETVLMRIQQPYPNHNGGELRFGPDGYLYIGTGDGGSAGDPLRNGQNTGVLLGKLLRIDVDSGDPYGIPPGNPFISGGGLPEVWAYGLRNPWRFSIDRLTGELFIGDVGQNLWEEIDWLPAGAAGGANFGWNQREGRHDYRGAALPGMIDPIAEYGHDQGCAVVGGVSIHSSSMPEWEGIYLFGDYCTGRIWGLLHNANWTMQPLFATPFTITAFGEDIDGRVYLTDDQGGVYRLQANP